MSEDFNSEINEMRVKDEMSSEDEDLVPDVQNPLNDDDIDIKDEEVDYPFHNSTSDSGHKSSPDVDTMFNVPHIDCYSVPVNVDQMDLNECYLDVLQCKRDCVTCQKYIWILSQHVRATHITHQPIQDPLLNDQLHIDPDPRSYHLTSAIQMKCEVDDGMEKIERSVEEPKSNSECDRNFDLENESDPDSVYSLPAPLTRKVRSRGSVKSHALSEPTMKKKNDEKKKKKEKASKKGIPSSQKKWKCKENECSKSFMHKTQFEAHMRTHTGEKPFECDVCQRCFSLKGTMITHKRIHTGEKPFQCKKCDKSFSSQSGLISHMRLHTGEKPFQCLMCWKRFSEKFNLTTHIIRHTGERPYKCEVCGKSFAASSDLINHRKIHT